MTKILYYVYYLLDSFHFCETHCTAHARFVANKSAISQFLSGIRTCTYIYIYICNSQPYFTAYIYIVHDTDTFICVCTHLNIYIYVIVNCILLHVYI